MVKIHYFAVSKSVTLRNSEVGHIIEKAYSREPWKGRKRGVEPILGDHKIYLLPPVQSKQPLGVRNKQRSCVRQFHAAPIPLK
jgi:hypothetical protein